MDFSVVLARACNYMCGHVAIMTETESTYMYVMIESTLWFDDVGIVPGLLWRFKGHVCSQQSGVGDGLGMRLSKASESTHNLLWCRY